MSPPTPSSRPARGPESIEAVVFDCFGTLANFVDDHFIQAFETICRRGELAIAGNELWERWLEDGRALTRERGRDPADPLAGPEAAFTPYRQRWALQFERTFRSLACSGDATSACAQIIDCLGQAACFPEVPRVLDVLRGRYRLAVLSNADEDFLRACLACNGIAVDVVISSEAAGSYKPRPGIFRRACDLLGLEPEHILYAGDSPIADVLGARTAGMAVAWVNRAGVPLPDRIPAPDREVSDLWGLAQWLGVPDAGIAEISR